jgi:hypothetical protein
MNDVVAVVVAYDDEMKRWKIRFEMISSSDRVSSSDQTRYLTATRFLEFASSIFSIFFLYFFVRFSFNRANVLDQILTIFE